MLLLTIIPVKSGTIKNIMYYDKKSEQLPGFALQNFTSSPTYYSEPSVVNGVTFQAMKVATVDIPDGLYGTAYFQRASGSGNEHAHAGPGIVKSGELYIPIERDTGTSYSCIYWSWVV